MNIGDAAKRSELSAKTIRYYEEIGLVTPARLANGYRDYTGDDVHRLRFVQRSRRLGFTIEQCRSLLALYADKSRASADVKAMVADRIAEIDAKLTELTALKTTLQQLSDSCRGDDRPPCPIIDGLAAEGAASESD